MMEYIKLCQTSPNRKATTCPECGDVLQPIMGEDISIGVYIYFSSACGFRREIEKKEFLGFRMFGALLEQMQARGNQV